MFDRLAEDLARDHRVLVPDLRGHGRSAVPQSPWRIADLADDLTVLLDDSRVPRVTLLGFSMGGMAAVDFALRYGSRLEGLALVGTSAAAEDLVRIAEIRTLGRIIQLAGQPPFLAREASRAAFSPAFRKVEFRRGGALGERGTGDEQPRPDSRPPGGGRPSLPARATG